MTRKPSSTAEYLDALPSEQRAAVERLRAVVRAAAPAATEPLPWELVARLVKARVDEIEAGTR